MVFLFLLSNYNDFCASFVFFCSVFLSLIGFALDISLSTPTTFWFPDSWIRTLTGFWILIFDYSVSHLLFFFVYDINIQVSLYSVTRHVKNSSNFNRNSRNGFFQIVYYVCAFDFCSRGWCAGCCDSLGCVRLLYFRAMVDPAVCVVCPVPC